MTTQPVYFPQEQITNRLHNSPIRFSTRHLDPLIQHMREAKRERGKADIREQPIVNIPHGYDFTHCVPEIRRSIESMNAKGSIYSFRIGNRQIEVALISVATRPNLARFLNKSIKRIYEWLYIANQAAPVQCSQKMNIYIYFTEFKKTLPARPGPIEDIHANTGVTTACKKVTEIHIFREEEWFKVLIHECFHCMGLDFSAAPENLYTSRITKWFPMPTEINLYETYCESWAEIINVCFLAGGSMRKIEVMLSLERDFSLFQCAKVLHFYGLSYTDIYDQSVEARTRRQKRYKETTNVFAYYVLKSILFFHLDKFMIWCENHTKHTFAFQSSAPSIESFCDLLGQQSREPELITQMKFLETWFSKGGAGTKDRGLRMTTFEL